MARDPEPAEESPGLLGVLEEAQRRGFIGPGPLAPHVRHSEALAATVEPEVPGRAVDLGSGGGLPGLVLAQRWTGTAWLLLDANERRGSFLRWAVDELGLADRAAVFRGRAEEAAHLPELRAGADLVVARLFGPPSVVAECAAGLLRVGGLLVVSEPPDGPDRWPSEGLGEVGLAQDAIQAPGFARLRQERPCPDRYPRRVGIPAKRPLF